MSSSGIKWNTVSSKAHPVKIWWETRFPGDEARAVAFADAIDSDIWPQLTQVMAAEPLPDCGAGCPSGGGDPALDVYLIGPAPFNQLHDYQNPPDEHRVVRVCRRS